jgi:hypothetical protein
MKYWETILRLGSLFRAKLVTLLKLVPPLYCALKAMRNWILSKAGWSWGSRYIKYGCEAQPLRGKNKFRSELLQDKIDLIDFTFTSLKAQSFADLGGIWGVNGGYTFYALAKYDITSAVLVDTHPTVIFKEQSRNYKQLRFIHGNFGDEQAVHDVGQVDAVFLFDVLLHQVAPDWNEVIEMYAPRAQCLVIYNQQWVHSNRTIRLLELGEEEYFQNVPHGRTEAPYDNLFQKLNQKHPDHGRPWKDVHHIWQWGITDADLQSKIEGLGFRMQFYKNCGKFGNLENFENHAYVFSRYSGCC